MRRNAYGNRPKAITRRSFLASTAAVGALAATASLGCTSTQPQDQDPVEAEGQTQPAAQAPAPAPAAIEQTFINTCRGNCGGSCALKGLVRDGKLVSTMPIELPKEYEGFHQGCVKGLGNPLRVYGTHRITHPLLQTGERGSDQWEKVSWDEALSLVAEKFQAAFDANGPQSVALWTGAGDASGYLSGVPFNIANWAPGFYNGVGVSRFAQKTGVTMLGNGGDQAGMYMLFNVLSTPKHSSEDYRNAKTIVLWGSNPAEASLTKSNWYWICKARENGAKLIVVDPLYTSAAGHADSWLPIRVGTDAALMNAVSNYLIDNGLASMDYLKMHSVAPLLTKEDGAYLRLSDIGGAEAGTSEDVPLVWDETSQDAVAHSASAAPALSAPSEVEGFAVRTVYDLTRESIAECTVEFAAEECGLSVQAIVDFANALVENHPTFLSVDWGIEHTYNAFSLYYASAFLASVVGDANTPGGGYSAPNSSASTLFKGPASTNPAALAVEGALPTTVITGDYLVEILSTGTWAGQPYPITCLYIQAHNPLDNGNDPLGMVEAWKQLDFVVCAEQFMTTTAHYSDLVLPVTMSWETEEFNGTYMRQKAIEPTGEARSDFDIWCGIAKAMGLDDLYDKTAEEYLRELLDTPENREAGTDYDAYHEQGLIIGEYVYGETAGIEYNPLGRTQFYVEQFIPRDIQGLEFGPEDRMPAYRKAAEAYPDNPAREQYPLFGFSNHNNYHGQSMHAHSLWLDEYRTCKGDPYCLIHTSAAKERGIVTGDLVRAYNDHGSVVLRAVVTEGIQPESVNFPHGFFWDEFVEGFAQSLTAHVPDPQTCNANFNDFICQVEKYQGGAE